MAERQVGLSQGTIKKILLHSAHFPTPYDLVPHIKELNIYESLFRNALTANITLHESFNLPEKLTIVGEELIEFHIEIPGFHADETAEINPVPMYVHKITNRKLKSPQSQEYALELVSGEYMNNVHTRISKAYCDMKASRIAFNIWSNYLWVEGRTEYGIFEPTERLEQCVIPNWSPHYTLNWLAQRSTSLKNPYSANYVFYQDLNGSNFRSIETMVQGESVISFALEPAQEDPTHIEYFTGGVVKADSIDIRHQPEIIKNINRGCYASKLITHDIVTKEIRQYKYNLLESWNQLNHINKEPPVKFSRRINLKTGKNVSLAPDHDLYQNNNSSSMSDYADSSVMFAPKHNQMYSVKSDHVYDNKVEDWKLQRNSQLSLLDGLQFNVQCGGIPNLRVGMCVDIYMMAAQPHRKEGDSKDKALSGKCLIIEIRHAISSVAGKTEYKMWLTLCKDGIGK